MYTMNTIYPMYIYRHMEKSKKVIRQIKLIGINRRLFWKHPKVPEVGQGAVHVPHDHDVPYVQGQTHGEVQEGHEANQIVRH
jgi:hypothetical protein